MILNKVLNIFKPKVNNRHITILVIDDGEVDQKVACAAVERGGYSVLKAYDGRSGIDLARQQPDLIVLDYNLPDINGPEVCKILKADELTSNIPVLFLTTMDSPVSIINCYEQGGENYLAKPISPQLLLKQIDLTLNDKKLKEK